MMPNPITALDAAFALYLHTRRHRRGASEFCRSLRHEVAFNTAWRSNPDQALRVAAGIPRVRHEDAKFTA